MKRPWRLLVLFAALNLGVGHAAEPAKDAPAAPAEEYPLRAKYPEVRPITTPELTKRISEVVVVDVRSGFEYKTLRVKDAVHIQVSDFRFDDKVRELYEARKLPLVFYCNGTTCAKSYDAARKAIRGPKIDCYVYDPGIFDWAKNNPDRTELLGKGPIKTSDLIDKEKFKARLIEPKDFTARMGPNAIVLDVRDRSQRDVTLFPFQEKRIPFDQQEEMNALFDQAKRENKTLLIYDKVGHQVQWMQYHLERSGVRNYYFMKGGEEGYFKATLGASTLDKLK
jgi:rhodanese-related sulfurtransferase